MKFSFMLLSALLVGCSHSEEKTPPDGALLYRVECAAASDPAGCVEIAKRNCKKHAYEFGVAGAGWVGCYEKWGEKWKD